MKDYLEYENGRNRTNAALYERMLRLAYGECQVMIGHHIGMEFGGDLQTENEIPSADTLLFDHDIMGKVFGDRAIDVMQELAGVPCWRRDGVLARRLREREIREAQAQPMSVTILDGDDTAFP